MDRRTFLQASGAGALTALWSPRAVFAATPGEQRLVFIFLRGGLDSLHAMPPFADPHYRQLRPTLALSAPAETQGVLDIDGYFGLHQALAPLHSMYLRGDLALLPAAATGYRDRSHFDGQNLLENGSGQPYGARDGWLNRAIVEMNGGEQRLGLALGPNIPLILQGDGAVQTWSDSRLPAVSEEFLQRLSRVYQDDVAFYQALEKARDALTPDVAGMGQGQRLLAAEDLSLTARAAADLLARPDGPRIAVIESQGWDTHFDQERRLAQLFASVAGAVVDLEQGLGESWSNTVVLLASEFGRTAAENGSRGTDHGTGGIALLAGGAVRGGRVLGDWPGLSERALFEGRDLLAVNSYESVFKALLIDHLGIDPGMVDRSILPGNAGVAAMHGLFSS